MKLGKNMGISKRKISNKFSLKGFDSLIQSFFTKLLLLFGKIQLIYLKHFHNMLSNIAPVENCVSCEKPLDADVSGSTKSNNHYLNGMFWKLSKLGAFTLSRLCGIIRCTYRTLYFDFDELDQHKNCTRSMICLQRVIELWHWTIALQSLFFDTLALVGLRINTIVRKLSLVGVKPCFASDSIY